MTVVSLIWRDHSKKITWNAIVKFAYRCFLGAWVFRNHFSHLYPSYFHIWNKNHRSNDFLFLIFHSVKVFNSLGKQLLRIFFFLTFKKLTGKDNVMEFMFRNTARKHREGPFSDNFLELLEKVNSTALVTDCLWTC